MRYLWPRSGWGFAHTERLDHSAGTSIPVAALPLDSRSARNSIARNAGQRFSRTRTLIRTGEPGKPKSSRSLRSMKRR